MTTDSTLRSDFRAPTASKRIPRAVANAGGGTIIAVADVAGSPERVFQALTTNEVEQWWGWPDHYYHKDWKAQTSAPADPGA